MGPSIAPSRAVLVLAVLAGLLLGVGGFTFLYAEGFSYMSDDPKVWNSSLKAGSAASGAKPTPVKGAKTP